MGSRTMTAKKPVVSGQSVPTSAHEEIATRAYQHYQQRGELDGCDLDDWLQAEREWLEEHGDVVISDVADE